MKLMRNSPDLATLGFSELVFPVFTTTSKVAVGLRPGQQVHILQGCHGEMARQPEPGAKCLHKRHERSAKADCGNFFPVDEKAISGNSDYYSEM